MGVPAIEIVRGGCKNCDAAHQPACTPCKYQAGQFDEFAAKAVATAVAGLTDPDVVAASAVYLFERIGYSKMEDAQADALAALTGAQGFLQTKARL